MRTSVELFAGAGGLALGISNAGFKHKAVVEWDADACKTIRVNQALRVKHVSDWKLHHADVRNFDFSSSWTCVGGSIAGGQETRPDRQ